MSVKIVKKVLSHRSYKYNAMAFLPSLEAEQLPYWAIFTHGFTASKSDAISWAQRLSESGISTLIFDLPGHYLGSYNEVESFEEFRDCAHECFLPAFVYLNELADQYKLKKLDRIILGGHSLGALLSIKAMILPEFEKLNPLAIAVGLGIGQHKEVHLFESSFYQKTLNIRRQLVSPSLDSDKVFPWIKDEKLKLKVSGKRIHLITGKDDVVIGPGGLTAMKEELERVGNIVSADEPKKLSHHEPSLAATHIYHFLKKELNF